MTVCMGSERLLAIIPAYNEDGAIRKVVEGVRKALPNADVLVVDDGSVDRTASEALSGGAIVVRHPFNLGIGATVQTALIYAYQEGYDVVVRLDGDGQHEQAEIPRLLAVLYEQPVDAVFGSRFLGTKALMDIPIPRRIGILCFACLVSLLTRQRATDTTSGFYCLNRRAIQILASFMPQDYPEVEGRVILHKANLKVTEVATQMHERRAGVSSINSWRSMYYALKVSVAVLITALKDVPSLPKELGHVNTLSTAGFGRHLQPALAAGDRTTDSQAQAS